MDVSTHAVTRKHKGCWAPRWRALARALCAALDVSALALSVPTIAATITVNTTADNTDLDGKCSLREAIQTANSNSNSAMPDCVTGSGADTIVFDPAVFPPNTHTTISLISGALNIGGDPGTAGLTTIDGNGAVVLDGGGANPVLRIETSNGQQPTYVLLTGLTIRNGYSVGNGGGIGNYGGQLFMDQCTVTNNVALLSGGGIFTTGGGMWGTGGSVVISNSALADNSADRGGGIFIEGSGSLEPALTNSTLTGNSSTVGGGIYVDAGPLELNFVTVSGNSSGGGLAIKLMANTYMNMRQSIVADAAGGGSCVSGSGFAMPNDGGGNDDDGASCGFSSANGSFPNADPQLGALLDNGGPTPTRKPAPGSPVVDKLPCVSGGTDQRGVARPQGRKCDIGAVELEDAIFSNGFD